MKAVDHCCMLKSTDVDKTRMLFGGCIYNLCCFLCTEQSLCLLSDSPSFSSLGGTGTTLQILSKPYRRSAGTLTGSYLCGSGDGAVHVKLSDSSALLFSSSLSSASFIF